MILVDPAYTSQECSNCGYISRDNRKSQSDFLCKLCGLEINADYNASINISQRDIVNYPNVATSELVTSQRL